MTMNTTKDAPPATMDQYYADIIHRMIVGIVKKQGNFKTILDVGCGNGLLGELLIKQNNRVFGVDIHEEKVKRCCEKGIIATRIANKCHLPDSTDSFELVTCCEVLEHLTEPDKMAREIKRVLRSNGLFIATVPNMYDIKTRLAFLIGKWSKITYGANLGHIRFFSKKTFRKLVEDEGFVIEKCISTGFASYLPRLFGGLCYIFALGNRLKKQKMFQDFNILLGKVFGWTSLGGGLFIVARKK